MIVEPSSLEGAQGKLSATIVHILFPGQVKHIRTLPCWPSAFDTSLGRESEECAASASKAGVSKETGSDNSEDGGSDVELFENTNRVNYDSYEEDNESEEEDEGEEAEKKHG